MPPRSLALLGLLLSGCGTIGLEASYFDTGTQVGPGPGPDTTDDSGDGVDTDETDPDNPSAPELSSFDMTERSTASSIQVAYEAFDLDGDLTGGQAELTLGGQSYSIAIPGDLDEYSATGTSRFQVSASHLSAGETVNGVLYLTDAAGHRSGTLTDSLVMAGSVYILNETGDEERDGQNIGVISLPATLEGDIYRASNDGYAYTGDMDWIEFRVASTTDAHFSLTWASSGSDYDLHLLLNGATEAQSIQDGGTQPESFTRTLQGNTTYVIVVAGWNGSAGDYTLVIE
jgi:hypothetical protein